MNSRLGHTQNWVFKCCCQLSVQYPLFLSTRWCCRAVFVTVHWARKERSEKYRQVKCWKVNPLNILVCACVLAGTWIKGPSKWMQLYSMPIYLLHLAAWAHTFSGQVPPGTSAYKIKQLFTQCITINVLPKGYNLWYWICKRMFCDFPGYCSVKSTSCHLSGSLIALVS